MRSNVEGSRLSGNLLMEKNKLGHIFQLLGATFTMDADMPPLVSLDPGGSARTVLLPAEEKGLWFLISNTANASELLTVKEDSNTTTIATLDQDEYGLFFCSVNEAGALEWRALTPSGIGDALTLGSLTVSGATALNGNTDIGNAVTDTVGFYGSTKVVQPASASQAAVTLTFKTALVTTLKTALVTTLKTAMTVTAATAAGTTGAIKTTGAAYGYTTSTQANKIVSLVNQLTVDLASVKARVDQGVVDVAAIKARVDQGVVDVASVKARIDQGIVDMAAVNVLLTAIRAGLIPTSGVGVLKGAA